MSYDRTSRHLYLFPAILGIWLILASVVLMKIDPENGLLVISLLAFTTALAVTNLFPFAGWVGAMIGVVVSVLVGFSGDQPGVGNIFVLAVESATLLGTALVSALAVRSMQRTAVQLDRDQKLIRELELYDHDTGLLNWQYALRNLKSEIARSQRYERDISLFLLQLPEPTQIGSGETLDEDVIRDQIATILTDVLRAVDVPFITPDGRLGGILPETNPSGALVAVERLEDRIARHVRLPVSIGVANFPSDAVTVDDLVEAAEAAVQVATTSDHPIVMYSQVRTAVEQDKPVTSAAASKSPDAIGQHWESQVLAPSQERIQSTGEGRAERLQALAEAAPGESIIGIGGMRNPARIQQIERLVAGQPGVEEVRIVEYDDGMLALAVRLQGIAVADVLHNIEGLELREVNQGDRWVEVYLETGEAQ